MKKKSWFVCGVAALASTVLLAGCDVQGIFDSIMDALFPEEEVTTTAPTTTRPVVEGEDGLSIHFLTLGNKYAGDSIYIKAGDTDILIDAGSRQGSAATIEAYVDQYCTDGVLEYVVATHADQDHIAAFVGTKDAPGIFDYYECKTIIDFNLTNKTGSKETAVLRNYYAKRDAEVEAGAAHYTALECYNRENGAQRTYTLADGIEMEILYNYYYENESSDENNYSVCLMINQGNNHYLLTGDLEGEGEKKLVQNNNLPHCVLYKANHHGSNTSSTNALLEEITPEICVVSCCCGSTEYTTNLKNVFPSQEFCTNISAFTDRVYVTSIVTEDGFAPLNGNVVVSCMDAKTVTVTCSESDILFKDTAWCKENRVWGEE